MKNLVVGTYQKVRVEDVIISDVTHKLYDYSNRNSEVNALMKTISEIGQQEPIIVLRYGEKFIILDGVLRLMAINRLNLNEINAIVSDFEPTDQFSLTDYIIHLHIRKEKTENEKLNEIKYLLRIGSDDVNPLRDKEKRVKLISNLMGGKGWGRNNVYYLEKILQWEKENTNELCLSTKVVSNDVKIARALDAIDLVDSNQFLVEEEKESNIICDFLRGSYERAKAQELITDYKVKKFDIPTSLEIHPLMDDNFQLILGNAETVTLQEGLQIDVIFTSPPYYRLRKYGLDPNELGWEKTPDLYVKRLADILMRGFAHLKDSGSMYINIGESYDYAECFAVIERLTLEMINRGALYIDRLIWEKKVNKPMRNNVKRLKNSYEVVLHFAKTKDYYFERFKINKDKSLKVARGCKEHLWPYKSFHIPNKYGSPDNFLSEKYLENILRVQMNQNRPKHIAGEVIHPATFPTTLPLIPLMISCPKSSNSVIFDPFSGTSATGITALQLGFKFIGIELYEENIASSRRMLRECQNEYYESLESNINEIAA